MHNFCSKQQIQLLADLSLKKTPQLVQLVDSGKVTEQMCYVPIHSINDFTFNRITYFLDIMMTGYGRALEFGTRKSLAKMDELSIEKGWLQKGGHKFFF